MSVEYSCTVCLEILIVFICIALMVIFFFLYLYRFFLVFAILIDLFLFLKPGKLKKLSELKDNICMVLAIGRIVLNLFL